MCNVHGTDWKIYYIYSWGLDARRTQLCRCHWVFVGCCVGKAALLLEELLDEVCEITKDLPSLRAYAKTAISRLEDLCEDSNVSLASELMAEVDPDSGEWQYDLEDAYHTTLQQALSC